MTSKVDKRWQELFEGAMSEVSNWRREHSRASFTEIEEELEQVQTGAGIVSGGWEEDDEFIEISDEDLEDMARAIIEQEDEEKRQAEIDKLADDIAELEAELIVSRGGSA